MNQGLTRILTRILSAAALAAASFLAHAQGALDLQGCPSEAIGRRFEDFGRTGRMPPELGRWLSDTKAQYVAPFRAFDNVYFVGVCWVSAWLITTPEGAILIDTVHEPHVDQMIANIRAVGVDPKTIKYVLITHGHYDHAGGAYKIKPLTGAKVLMTQAGWDEALKSSAQSQGTPRAWTMLPQDGVVRNGDLVQLGGVGVRVLETPGHTWGTASYAYDAKDGPSTYHAVTVGGLGLNAIEGSKQVEAYIASIDHLLASMASPQTSYDVHLTTHPFSTGLFEAAAKLAGHVPGQAHPLVDPEGFRKQLLDLKAGAVERLAIEKKAGR